MVDNSAISSINKITGLPTISNNPTGISKVFSDTIGYILAYEEQPLLRLQQDRNSLDLRKQAYNNIQEKITTLQTSAQSLMSGGFSQLQFGRSAMVTSDTINANVATATAGNSAILGNYSLTVSQLALSYLYVSTSQSSSTEALNRSGTLILGGNGTRSVEKTIDTDSVINSVSLSDVSESMTELSKDVYAVETRNFNGTNQFRITNKDGNAVAVANKNYIISGDVLTSDWQTLVAGNYDTKRGLSIDFSGDVGAKVSVAYNPAGATINVETSDSLLSIAEKVNNSNQLEGGGKISATIINNQLVFAGSTGENNDLSFSDNNVGLGFIKTQDGLNANFTINNIPISRNSNTELTDVISGVSLNLLSDAIDKNATIQIKENVKNAQSSINSYISNFNSVVDFINTETILTKPEGQLTYTRGSLYDDTVFADMRSKLLELTMGQYSNEGKFSMLSEIGISFDDNLKLTIVDNDKLNNALNNNFNDVRSLLNASMTAVNNSLNNYTGNDGYVQSATDVLTTEFKDLSESIRSWQLILMERKTNLETQYASIQSQLLEMQYTFQSWQGIYNNTTSFLG